MKFAMLFLLLMGCAEYKTKSPIINLTDCPYELPENVIGLYALAEVETVRLVNDFKRAETAPVYTGRLEIDVDNFTMSVDRRSWHDGVGFIRISGVAGVSGKDILIIYELDDLMDIIQVYEYSYFSRTLILSYFDKTDRVRYSMRWKKVRFTHEGGS